MSAVDPRRILPGQLSGMIPSTVLTNPATVTSKATAGLQLKIGPDTRKVRMDPPVGSVGARVDW